MKPLQHLALFLSAAFALTCPAETNDSQPFRLRGKVVDAEGRPVAGATVERYDQANGFFQASDMQSQQRVTTGTDGAFELTLPQTSTLLLARKAGLVPGWNQYWKSTKDLTDERLVLPAPTSVAGVVVDEAEKPVADAEVWVSAAYNERPGADGATFYGYLSGKLARQCFSTRTGPDGKFRFESFPANVSADLVASKPGKALRQLQRDYTGPDNMLCHSGQQDVKLVVEPAGNIEGKVVARETGQPLPGVLFSLQVSRPGVAPEPEPVQSGADGTFRLADVVPGHYQIRATFGTNALPEWVADTVPVDVELGQTTRNVQVSAGHGGFLEVSVLGKEDRKPLAKVQVNATKGAFRAGGVSTTNGKLFLRLPAGEYQVTAYGENIQPQKASASVENNQTNRLEIELEPPPRITGVVLDPAGAPAAGIPVTLWPANRANSSEEKTDAQGRYQLNWNPQRLGSASDMFCLIARDPARNLAVAEDIDQDTRSLDLRLAPGLAVAGRVEDAQGKPLTNASVRLYLWSSSGYGSRIDEQPLPTDAQGRFEVAGLPQGRKYSVDAAAKGYGSASHRFEGSDAETNRLEFEPLVLKVADRKIAGQVLDADEKPVARAWVNMYGQDQTNNHMRTDDQGRFKFDSVCEGQIQVSASSQRAYASARAEAGDTNIVIRLSARDSLAYGFSSASPTPQRASLKGKPLPDLANVNLAAEAVPAGKPLLLCLFDIDQRPSRRWIRSLAEQKEALQQKGVLLVGIQAAVVTPAALKEWKDANPVPFPVGHVAEKAEKTKWIQVETLPWLILTGSDRRVTAEGFALEELDAKLKALSK